MHIISAKILAKAAAFTYEQNGPMKRPNIKYILVSKVWIQSTDGHAAFRAPGPIGFTGYLKLTPKLTKSGSPRVFPKTASEVRFPDDVTEISAPRAHIVNVKEKLLGELGDFFDAELLWERPHFPNFDRIFPAKNVGKSSPTFLLDLALLSKLMIGEDPSVQLDVKVELGPDSLSPFVVKNCAADRNEAWEVLIAPMRP